MFKKSPVTTVVAIVSGFMGVVLLILAVVPDDELEDDAIALARLIDGPGTSDAYFYLLGISAPAGEKPAEYGEKLFRQSQARDRQASDSQASDPDTFNHISNDSDSLPSPDEEWFCAYMSESACLEKIFSADIDLQHLKGKYRELLSRYEHFLSFTEYRTLSKPSVNEIYPQFGYLTRANRIYVLESIALHKSGDSNTSIDLLQKQIARVRKALELQDSLLGKMIFVAIINELVDVAGIIASESEVTAEPIVLLDAAERNFKMVAAREFGIFQATTRGVLIENPDLEDNSWFSKRILKIFYKTNMTVNAGTHNYLWLGKLASLSFNEFSQVIGEQAPNRNSSPVWNPVGYWLLSQQSKTDWSVYGIRMLDLNAKIYLFNQRYHHRTPFSVVVNPYNENKKIEISYNKVCVESFVEDERVRCLLTSYNSSETASYAE